MPTFKGYRGFPASICASPNDMVVHGIPGAYTLRRGRLISIDVGVTLDGFVADSARTFPVGEIERRGAAAARRRARPRSRPGSEQARAGNHVGDIGHAVQEVTEASGFSVVRELVGHGVGRSMHEEPQVPNFGEPGRGPKLSPGVTIAIEPMITAGEGAIVLADDGWSISTADGSLAAHFEHTVAVTEDGPQDPHRGGRRPLCYDSPVAASPSLGVAARFCS